MKIYLIGALKNPNIPFIANLLRRKGYEVFDDWFSPGKNADECWQEYETTRGRSYKQALHGAHARHIFEFDKRHLDDADIGILVMPSGRSGHLELGYLAGQGKPTFVLFDEEPARYDLMYLFANE